MKSQYSSRCTLNSPFTNRDEDSHNHSTQLSKKISQKILPLTFQKINEKWTSSWTQLNFLRHRIRTEEAFHECVKCRANGQDCLLEAELQVKNPNNGLEVHATCQGTRILQQIKIAHQEVIGKEKQQLWVSNVKANRWPSRGRTAGKSKWRWKGLGTIYFTQNCIHLEGKGQAAADWSQQLKQERLKMSNPDKKVPEGVRQKWAFGGCWSIRDIHRPATWWDRRYLNAKGDAQHARRRSGSPEAYCRGHRQQNVYGPNKVCSKMKQEGRK